MPRVAARVSEALLARLDALAGDVGRAAGAAAVRRLILEADAAGVPPPLETPDMDELLALASEKARQGEMAAINFLAARQPTSAMPSCGGCCSAWARASSAHAVARPRPRRWWWARCACWAPHRRQLDAEDAIRAARAPRPLREAL